MDRALRGPVLLLGSAQTLAWASSHYLPAILAVPMARDLGLAPATVFAAFSLALLASAAVGPWCGRLIDRHGGRPMLVASNLMFAAGIGSLAFTQGLWSLMASWLLIGVAMGCGLYDAAFSTLARLYGQRSRDAIAGITLLGGFASTVGWPLTAWMETQWGWRSACGAWAALHLVLGLPLNLLLPSSAAHAPLPTTAITADGKASPTSPEPALPLASRHAPWLLAFTFAAMGFITTTMAAHLPRLLQMAGATLAMAVLAGALIGPAQVAGRLLEIGVLRRLHPLFSARLATLGHPLGVLALMAFGPAAAPLFATLHGLGNGINTIVRGTLPLVLFGARGYGARQGWITLPARFTAALAPYAAGLALDAWGPATLWLTLALSLSALTALLALQAPASSAAPKAPD
jgi:MFS family permease